MLTNLLKGLKGWFEQWFDTRRKTHRLTPKILTQPRIVPRSEHSLSRRNISKYALKVLYRLHESGYQAYLVGGGVRDVLLGLHPKDFDVATNAHPEEVSALFSNSRLIGRRFRLVHVHFGRHIVEVATFRASPTSTIQDMNRARSANDGMILRDNVYGSLEEDVFRRDFTINALYYNIADYSVIDFVEGMKDLSLKMIRVIGDPLIRFREDPLRMLRAVRFAAKLNFEIETESEKAIFHLQHLLANVPAARLFDEYLKLFLGGFAVASFRLITEQGLLNILFPRVHSLLSQKGIQQEKDPSHTLAHSMLTFLGHALHNTDERIRAEKTISPHFLLAAFLWYPVLQEIEKEKEKDENQSFMNAFHEAVTTLLQEQRESFAIPRRLTQAIKEIWSMQHRLEKRHHHRAAQLFSHPRFRAAYDFLLLRAMVENSDVKALAEWWTTYIAADELSREAMAAAIKTVTKKPRKNRLTIRKANDC